MVSTIFLLILKFFDTFGLNTQFFAQSQNQYFENTILFIHIAIAVILSGCQIFAFRYIVGLDDAEAPNNFLQAIYLLLTYWILIFELHYRKNVQRKFWKIYRKISFDQYSLVGNSFTLKFVEYILYSLISSLQTMCEAATSDIIQLLLLIIPYVFLVKFCEMKIFFFILHIELILSQLRIIECQLNNQSLISNPNDVLDKLRRIEESFIILMDMIEQINDIFGWSLFVGKSFCFVFILTNLNWLIFYGFQATNSSIIGKKNQQFRFEFT